MPQGKAAGERCIQLAEDLRCMIFADPRRPSVCASLKPSQEMCQSNAQQAMAWLTELEWHTRPDEWV
jgi:hypothetical protein